VSSKLTAVLLAPLTAVLLVPFTAVLLVPFTTVLLVPLDQAEPIVERISRRDKERHVRNSLIPTTLIIGLIRITYQIISDPVICKLNTLSSTSIINE
jgi:hypothetical protein